MSADTSADIVCPVRLVASHAPFSLATTPGGTSSVTSSGRITSPRSFHTFTSLPCASPRAAASRGCIISRGSDPANPSVEVIRRSDAGEISISG